MSSKNYLAHYNHNHDKLGRFASGVGGPKDRVLKKGTVLNRIGAENENDKSKKWTTTYVSGSKVDDKIYTSLSGGKVFYGNHKQKLKTTNDIKVAGREAQAKAFLEVLKKTDIDSLVKHTNHLDTSVNPKLNKYVSDKSLRRLYKNVGKNQESFNLAYDAFVQNVDNREFLSREFFKILKNQGYKALVDDYDSHLPNKPGIINYNNSDGSEDSIVVRAENAMIFLDRRNDLMTEKITKIRKSDVTKANKWLKENGYISTIIQ